MADFNYTDLKTAYEDFRNPVIKVEIDGQDVAETTEPLFVNELDVEQTSGFEASLATISLTGPYDSVSGTFNIEKTKKYMFLGSSVLIYTGYGVTYREIFRGFVARVHFVIPPDNTDDVPTIELTAMDAKALMMANRHSKRLKAKFYSDAVKEVLQTNVFLTQKDQEQKDFITLNINDTPDKQEGQGEQGTTERRVEMVEESDYEFIVKAAKKFNFEFFIVGNNLYFVEAKSNTTPLIVLTPRTGLRRMDVGYDISGIVRSVEVRNIDMEEGKYVGDKKKATSKISLGSKAKPLVDKQALVYLDPTARSKTEAGYRAQYLMDSIDYRLGSINADFTGLPELAPGMFITLNVFGSPIDNNFYLTRVRHVISDNTYRTQIEGCANAIGS